MVEVRVWSLAVDEKNQFPVVILQSLDGTKRLPIWIGPPEASAIAMEIAEKRFQRPLTHDLLVSCLQGLGAKVRRVEITDLREGTYYAKIYLEANGELIAVDARPSDSLAVALKTKARIYVASQLFSSELDSLLLQNENSQRPGEEAEEDQAVRIKKLLENLNPKDFGRFTF